MGETEADLMACSPEDLLPVERCVFSPIHFQKPLMPPFSTAQITTHPWRHLSTCLQSTIHVSQSQPSERSLEVSVHAPESRKVCPLFRCQIVPHSLLFYSVNRSAKLPLPTRRCCPRYPCVARVVRHTSPHRALTRPRERPRPI